MTGRLGIADRVEFVGAVDQARLPLYYAAADATVIPSLYESFGLVAVESMACGTPVVAARVGGLATTIQDGQTGYLIPWPDPALYADRLGALLGDSALRQRLGERGLCAAARYDWAQVAEEILRHLLWAGALRAPRGGHQRRAGPTVGRMSYVLPPEFEDILFVQAHPDDADFGSAGTVARWAREGRRVHYLLCTSGDKGAPDAATRPAESGAPARGPAARSGAAAGRDEHDVPGRHDGELEVNLAFRAELTAAIRRLRAATRR